MSVARTAFAVARRTAIRAPAPRLFSTITARSTSDHLLRKGARKLDHSRKTPGECAVLTSTYRSGVEICQSFASGQADPLRRYAHLSQQQSLLLQPHLWEAGFMTGPQKPGQCLLTCYRAEVKSEQDLLPPGAAPGTVPSDLEQATGLERLGNPWEKCRALTSLT